MDENIIAFTCTTIARSNIYQTVERVIDLFITHYYLFVSFLFSSFSFLKIVAVRWKFILHMIYIFYARISLLVSLSTTSCVLHSKLMNVCVCVDCWCMKIHVKLYCNCYRQTETINFTNCTKYVPLCRLVSRVPSPDSPDALCHTAISCVCVCVRAYGFSPASVSLARLSFSWPTNFKVNLKLELCCQLNWIRITTSCLVAAVWQTVRTRTFRVRCPIYVLWYHVSDSDVYAMYLLTVAAASAQDTIKVNPF